MIDEKKVRKEVAEEYLKKHLGDLVGQELLLETLERRLLVQQHGKERTGMMQEIASAKTRIDTLKQAIRVVNSYLKDLKDGKDDK